MMCIHPGGSASCNVPCATLLNLMADRGLYLDFSSVTPTIKVNARLILDFTPSDLARLLGGFGELRNHNSELLEAASTRLRVSLIPMAQMSCDELAKV